MAEKPIAPRRRAPGAPNALAEAKRLVLEAPERAERIARAVHAILRAQEAHVDWMKINPRMQKNKELNVDERRAELERQYADDIERARNEGYESGRAAGGDGGAVLAAQRPARSKAAADPAGER